MAKFVQTDLDMESTSQIINMPAPGQPHHATRKAYIDSLVIRGFGSIGGSADAITAIGVPPLPALTNWAMGILRPTALNTGAVTFTPDGLTTKDLRNPQGAALIANQLNPDFDYLVRFDLANDYWQVVFSSAAW